MVKIRHLGRVLLGLVAFFAVSMGAKADYVVLSNLASTSPSQGTATYDETNYVYTYTSPTLFSGATTSPKIVRIVFIANNGASGANYPCVALSYLSLSTSDGTAVSYTAASNATQTDDGDGLSALTTEDQTYWHSLWGSKSDDYHYLQLTISDTDVDLTSGLVLKWITRYPSNSYSTVGTAPKRVIVLTGSSEDDIATQYEALKLAGISSIDNTSWDNSKLYVVCPGESSRGCWYYNSSDASYLNSTTKAGVTTASFTFDVADAMKFAFIQKQVGSAYHYYAYSPAANKFLTYTSDEGGRVALVDKPTSIGSFVDGNYSGAPFVYVLTTTSAHHVGISNSYTHGAITFYNSTSDGGNAINLYDISETASGTDFDAAVAAVNAADEDHMVAWWTLSEKVSTASSYSDRISSTELNSYTDGTGTYSSSLSAAQTALSTSESATTATTEELTTAATNLTTALNGLTINQPADGSFIRVRCTEYGMSYLYSENSTLSGKTERAKFGGGTASDGTTNAVETIFYYKDKKLVGFNNGYKLSEPSATGFAYFNGVQDGLDISFIAAKNGTIGQYNVTYPFTSDNSQTRYMYTRSTTSDDATYYYTDGANDNYSLGGCNYWLESITSLPVTITTACGGYATFYTPVDVSWSDTDVTAWQGKLSDDGKYLDLTEVTGTIPAGSAVLLKSASIVDGTSTSDKIVSFTVASSNTASSLSGNILTGDYAAATVSGTPYTLQPVDDTPGFYKYTGTVLKGFKGYMASAQNVLGLRFGGDATSINAIDANGNVVPSTVYDLSGRRVSNAANGLYIVNGKKVLVK